MEVIDITPECKVSAEKIRLAAYCRVSSDSSDQLHSFSSQILYYKEYEKSHPEYRLVDIYADEGITGTSAEKRDELNRLIRDCKKGHIDRVIVKSVSRLARNTQDLLIIIRTLKDLNVSVYFEEQGIDSSKLNSEMIVTFPGMAAQQESESISGNVRWSYTKRMKSGEYNTSNPAFGFELVNGKLVVKENEAETIRQIFRLYLDGYGMQEIASILNEENKSRRKSGKPWDRCAIKYILNNERYMSDAVLQKRYTTDTFPHKKKRNHGERVQYYVKNANPQIVSRELFSKAHELIRSRTEEQSEQKGRYPLSHKLYCPDCGKPFRRLQMGGKAYWICSAKSAKASNCNNYRVSEQAIYYVFSKMVYKLKDNNELLLGNLIRSIESVCAASLTSNEKVLNINQEMDNLAARNTVIARLHTNGILSGEEYARQSLEINARLAKLRSQKKKMLDNDESTQFINRLTELYGDIEDAAPSIDFNEDLFGQIVERIVVVNNRSVRFVLAGGIEINETIPDRMRCKAK